MRLKEITIRRGRTIYHGNYESSRIDVTMTAEIEGGDDSDACFDALDLKVRLKLDRKIEELHR